MIFMPDSSMGQKLLKELSRNFSSTYLKNAAFVKINA